MPGTTICKDCGTGITLVTAEMTGGTCMPCRDGRRGQMKGTYGQVEPGRLIDSDCIIMVKDFESKAYVDYFFEADVWDKDPRFESKWMVVGVNRGLMRLYKNIGSVELLQSMPEDENNRRFNCASSRIKQLWELDSFPDETVSVYK